MAFGTDRGARTTVRISPHMQAMALAMAVALAPLAPSVTHAQPASEARDVVCDTVARTVLAIDPPDDWRGPWQSPVRALGKSSAGVVSVDARTWRSDKAPALDKLRQEYRAEPDLLKAIGD